ncbi:DNA repair protein XRCC4-like isoform X2 [Nymphaea colorata]|uniref:DNA repair protein XRCC4-like isoform X2 n=1 Tax=Nymphaea colorata TaxID=210225 RepID=UPI00129DBE8C|nr:DNA repair protein XRCC4-like isoform X2 [Nymphaea colorata]
MATEEEDHGGGGFRHTCMRMVVEGTTPEGAVYYVKGTWYPSRFSLSIIDGLRAWVCNPSEQEVSERADNWDQPVSHYLQTAEQHLAIQQPGSSYAFIDTGDGHKRDEVVKKTHSFEKMKTEAEKSLSQCEILSREKEEFENSVYAKFVEVLNSKKAKLRELRDRISRIECKSGQPEAKDDSSDKTETYTGESDDGSQSHTDPAQTIPSRAIASTSRKKQKRKVGE